MKRLLILLMVVSQPVWADWTKLGEVPLTREAYTHYVDTASVRKTQSGWRIWTMYSFIQQQTNARGEPYQSLRMLEEVDCIGEKIRSLHVSGVSDPMLGGSTVWVDDEPKPWKFIPPNTAAASLFKSLCKAPLR